MPFEITSFGSNQGSFLAVATKTPSSGTTVSLYPQSSTPAMRKKWIFNAVTGGTQIALNSNPALVIATASTPVNGTTLQLVPATPIAPESLFVVYSQGSSSGSFIVSADPAASNGFFIDDSGNPTTGPVHMWMSVPGNQDWMITDVDDVSEE